MKNVFQSGRTLTNQKAFHLGKGDYFLAVEADDILDHSFIEKCLRLLEEDPVAIACCSEANLINEETEIVAQLEKEQLPDFTYSLPNSFISVGRKLSSSLHINGLIRRGALDKVLPMAEYMFQAEQVLLWELALYGSFRVVPELLYFKRLKLASQPLILSQDMERKQATNTLLSRLHHLYPLTRMHIEIMKRVTESRHEFSMRKQLMSVYRSYLDELLQMPAFKKQVDHEKKATESLIVNGLVALASGQKGDLKISFFYNSAQQAIADITMLDPDNDTLKETRHLIMRAATSAQKA